MSTTFGIFVPGNEIKQSNVDLTEDDAAFMDAVEIARRVTGANGAIMRFTNELAHLLPDEIKVTALDNSAQGISTIGDIKNHIKNQK
jgi:hypothetical protein